MRRVVQRLFSGVEDLYVCVPFIIAKRLSSLAVLLGAIGCLLGFFGSFVTAGIP